MQHILCSTSWPHPHPLNQRRVPAAHGTIGAAAAHEPHPRALHERPQPVLNLPQHLILLPRLLVQPYLLRPCAPINARNNRCGGGQAATPAMYVGDPGDARHSPMPALPTLGRP